MTNLYNFIGQMPFSKERFTTLVASQYSGQSEIVATKLFFDSLLHAIPKEQRAECSQKMIEIVLSRHKNCPYPVEIRLIFSEAVSAINKHSVRSACQRALFLKSNPSETREWFDLVLFSCAHHFPLIESEQQWLTNLADQLLSLPLVPVPEQVAIVARPQKKNFNFSQLKALLV